MIKFETPEEITPIKHGYYEELDNGSVVEFTLHQDRHMFYPPTYLDMDEKEAHFTLCNHKRRYLYVLAGGSRDSHIMACVNEGREEVFGNIYDVHFGQIQKIELPDIRPNIYFYFKMVNIGIVKGRSVKVKVLLSDDPRQSNVENLF